MSVGDLAAGLSVITLVGMCEQNYQCGMAIGFWGAISTPLGIFKWTPSSSPSTPWKSISCP
jgi:hypothetical protein